MYTLQGRGGDVDKDAVRSETMQLTRAAHARSHFIVVIVVIIVIIVVIRVSIRNIKK